MAKFSVCKHQSYLRKADDNNDKPLVFCKKSKDFCGSQKPCPELQKNVVTERAHITCKWFASGLKR